MKKSSWAMMTLLLISAAALTLNFSKVSEGGIKGKVIPAEGATKVQAISSTDTFSTAIMNGSFELQHVKPGSYNVSIEAVPPYRSTSKPGVVVAGGVTTDLGSIQLEGMNK